MNVIQKFQTISDWHVKNSSEKVRGFSPQNQAIKISHIGEMIGEEIPNQLVELWKVYDGETADGLGSFLGHSLMSLDEIAQHISFASTLIKPENPVVCDEEKSQRILETIVDLHIKAIPKTSAWRFAKPSWHKLVFECSPASGSGPYLYRTSQTDSKEREILSLPSDLRDEIWDQAKNLHLLEEDGYNWDYLEFTVFENGNYDVQRKFNDFDNQLSLECYPPDTMRIKYFHLKWLPVIHDGGGNYIGVDCDPGPDGHKNQIVVFGRDEEKMYVLANDWNEFLDLILEKITAGGNEFKAQEHLHDIFSPY